MKTSNIGLVLFVAALGGLLVNPLAAQGTMRPVGEVHLRGQPVITQGSSVNLVRQAIGSAHEQLTPDLWLYHNFQPVRQDAGNDACSDLIIRFEHDRVAAIYLADEKASAIMTARAERGQTTAQVAYAEPALPAGQQVAANR